MALLAFDRSAKLPRPRTARRNTCPQLYRRKHFRVSKSMIGCYEKPQCANILQWSSKSKGSYTTYLGAPVFQFINPPLLPTIKRNDLRSPLVTGVTTCLSR